MRKMGGIWKKIPYTYACMWVGSLALAGIPYFAGYFSKDMILEAAYADHTLHGQVAFWLGVTAAFMTAFYSWRLIFMTFHGKPRADHHVMDHVHESPPIMLLPLVPLFIGALGAGALGYYVLGMVNGDHAFWGGAISVLEENNTLEAAHHVPHWVPLLPLGIAISGIAMAWLCYIQFPKIPGKVAAIFKPVYLFLLNKWYVDELYDLLFVRRAIDAGKLLWKKVDAGFVDHFGPNGVARLSAGFARVTASAQTGKVYHYVFAMLAGLLGLVSWLIYVVMG